MNFTIDDAHPCILRRPSPIHELNYYMYGCITQAICILGIIGNVLNLIILTRPKMKSACYIYMRAKALTDIAAIIFTFPWAARHLKPMKKWDHYGFPFYHSYFELYLMNSFVAAGIFLMLAITVERFISVCYPLKARRMVGSNKRAYITSCILVVLALFLFIPYAFQSQVETFIDTETNRTVFTYCENKAVIVLTSWKFYRWAQQVICRFAPVVMIAIFNTFIVIGFRKIVKKRQQMKGKGRNLGDFRDQRKLTFMLLGLSVMFFLCETPAAILIGQISGKLKTFFGFQVFRAVANILEIVNYTFSFYAYCLASSEFRKSFFRIVGLKAFRSGGGGVDPDCNSRSKIGGQSSVASQKPKENPIFATNASSRPLVYKDGNANQAYDSNSFNFNSVEHKEVNHSDQPFRSGEASSKSGDIVCNGLNVPDSSNKSAVVSPPSLELGNSSNVSIQSVARSVQDQDNTNL